MRVDIYLPEEEEQRIVGVWGQRHLRYLKQHHKVFYTNLLTSGKLNSYLADIDEQAEVLWSSIFVTLMANKIGGLQFGIYRNCQISSRVFHTAVAALPLTKANRSDFE